ERAIERVAGASDSVGVDTRHGGHSSRLAENLLHRRGAPRWSHEKPCVNLSVIGTSARFARPAPRYASALPSALHSLRSCGSGLGRRTCALPAGGYMNWKDVAAMIADVAIVFYITYRVLLVIKGKRAAQGLIGLIVLGGAFILAKQLRLQTVSWLIDNLVSYGILLLIIVFQQDIRAALIRMGRNFLGPPRVKEDVDADAKTG